MLRNIPEPPFWGVRVRKDFDLRELFPYINETALFKNQWQLKTASQEDYLRLVAEKLRPIKQAAGGRNYFEWVVCAQGGVWVFPRSGDGNDVVYMSRRQGL